MNTSENDPDPAVALRAAGMGFWSWDCAQDQLRGDAQFAALLALDPMAQPWTLDTVVGVDDARAALRQAEGPFSVSFRASDTPELWVSLQGQAASGTLTGVIWDVTVGKAQEDRLSILAREMDHRVKNAFAVIQALINQGVRAFPDNAGLGGSLKAQVAAMATAHNVTARIARRTKTPRAPVPLQDVLEIALGAWRGWHDIDDKVPADLMLAPQEVAAVTMLIYELAANAAKYGALGARAGRLKIVGCQIADGHRALSWAEVCTESPLAQTDEARFDNGFGTVLVDHCARTLGATVSRDMTDVGLTIVLTLPPVSL